ncbi:MAG: histidine phosphatase family protein [Clostridia bacterium]|nr:histidine phosphatase family protein [Clostridia bacterium]
MYIYLIRHGKDDETVRGGWSNSPLTEEGILQVHRLADEIEKNKDALAVKHIFSSDLPRTVQTAKPIAEKLGLPVVYLSDFREVNNGDLAGMKNEIAVERYPGLFWNTLAWDEKYPNGESPKDFYERISHAWYELKKTFSCDENMILVTHSGVIHVILSLVEGKPYSNKGITRKIGNAEIVTVQYDFN